MGGTQSSQENLSMTTPPNKEPVNFGPHKSWVTSVCPIPTSVGVTTILVSGGYDQSVRFWEHAQDLSQNDEGLSLPQNDEGSSLPLVCKSGQNTHNTIRALAYLDYKGQPTVACGESAFDGALIEFVNLKNATITKTLKGHRMAILDVNVIEWQSEQLLLSCGPDLPKNGETNLTGVINVFNLTNEDTLTTLEHTDRILSVDIQKGSYIVAAGSYDTTVLLIPKLIEKGTDENKSVLTGHKNYITGVQFDPTNFSNLLSCSYDGSVKIWSVMTQVCLQTLSIENEETQINYHDLRLNQDGLLAVGSNDGNVRLWDVNAGKLVRTLKVHRDMVLSVNFSEDGKYLFTGSKDCSVKLWDLRKTVMDIK